MSTPLKDPNAGPTPQNQDHIDFTKVITVGVVSLVIFAIASYWAFTILRGERAQLALKGETSVPTELGKKEIGIVDQVPFDSDKRLEAWKQAQKEHLEGYGWVDRKRGIIDVPIEQAMTEIAAGAVPGPPEPPPGPSQETK